MASNRVSIRPLQIAAHPYNNSLVVLVHGILSGRYSAWEPAIDMIQEMYELGAMTATFGSFDYYAFGYESAWRQPTLKEFIEPLRALVSRDRYDTVVLIGHSQGGLLAKLFLIDELRNRRGDQTKVDIVITLDTPHRGPQPWIYPFVMTGAIWKRIPILRRRPVFRQAADLGFFASNLQTVRNHWNETLFPQTPCTPQPNRRHVRSYTVSGTVLPVFHCKVVVSDNSARGFDIDEPLEIPELERRAWGSGHGVAAMMNYRLQIERLLSEHDVDGILEARRQLAGASSLDLEPLLADTCPPEALRCEADSWCRRLTRGVAQRPLRKLSAVQAMKKFVELRLRHP